LLILVLAAPKLLSYALPHASHLPAGGLQADLVDCRFSNTAKQAIEVRQGGCLTGHGLHIEGCLQGVSAYGGARSVVLRVSLSHSLLLFSLEML
jgi:hypothetical protein